MKIFFLLLILAAAQLQAQVELPGRVFLRSLFGGGPADLSQICHPSDDLWMIPGGRRDEQALQNIARLPEQELTNSVTQGVVPGTRQMNLYFFEMREGKVDAQFTLNGIYNRHRQLVLFFVKAALSQDQFQLRRVITDATKVKFDGPKAPSGEMGQYEDILSAFPVVRSSDPKNDAKTKSITYRVPLGTNALSLKIIKDEGMWKIDTSEGLTIPTWVFFR